MGTQLDRFAPMLAALYQHLGVRAVEAPRPREGRDVGTESGRRYVGIVSRFGHDWEFTECPVLSDRLPTTWA